MIQPATLAMRKLKTGRAASRRESRPGKPGRRTPRQRRRPDVRGQPGKQGPAGAGSECGRCGAARKFPSRPSQRKAIRGDPAIEPMAKPEGDSAARAARSHQPEPEDSHRGASRRRIVGDTERAVCGETCKRTIGTAERMRGRETGPWHRRQSRTCNTPAGQPAGVEQAAHRRGTQWGNPERAGSLAGWGYRPPGQPGARPTGAAYGQARGAIRVSRRRRGSGAWAAGKPEVQRRPNRRMQPARGNSPTAASAGLNGSKRDS